MSTLFYNNITFFQITVILCTGGLPPNPITCFIIRSFRNICQDRNTDFLFRDLLFQKVAQAVSLQSLAPQPLIST